MSRGMKLKDGGVKPGCQRVARLQVVLTELDSFGVFQIDTGSFNSIVNVNSAIDMLRRIAGRISWIEVPLTLVPQKVTVPDTGKQSTIYVLTIQLPVSVKNFAPLTPLIEYANERRIERLEGPQNDMPTDLVPLALQGPQTATVEVVEDAAESEDDDADADAGDVDAETGEVYEEDSAPFEAAAPDFASDPDVLAAFEAAAFGPAKRGAFIASATSGNWSKDALLAAINKHNAPKPAPAAASGGNGRKRMF
jgi:hypothetical protein